MHVSPNNNISKSSPLDGCPRPKDGSEAGRRLKEVAEVSHQLMGSVSALLMCEHLILKELRSVVAPSSVLMESLSLLKDSIDQVHHYGDTLMALSNDQADKPSA